MHTEIEKSNREWADRILSGQRVLNAESQLQQNEDQRRFRQQIMLALFGATLSIISALVVVVMTAGRL